MPSAITNGGLLDRIQLLCSPLVGPFSQNGPLGSFDPRRDVFAYVDGKLIPVTTFSFDPGNNRYLLYLAQQINVQGMIQLVHRMPNPPFTATGAGGFGALFGVNFDENSGSFGSNFGISFDTGNSGGGPLAGFAIIASFFASGS